MIIGSFNVKNEYNKEANIRKAKQILELINSNKIDVLGLQEVTNVLLQELKRILEPIGYTVTESFRLKNHNSMRNESNTVISKYKVISSRTLWLSEKPEVIGSKSYYTLYPRSINISNIDINGVITTFINVHLDIFSYARRKQLDKLYSIIEELKDNSIVLFGDFNVTNDIDYFINFCKKLESIGVKHVVNDKETFKATKYHHFNGPIDHMFISDSYEVQQLDIIDTGISDHRMVIVKVNRKKY